MRLDVEVSLPLTSDSGTDMTRFITTTPTDAALLADRVNGRWQTRCTRHGPLNYHRRWRQAGDDRCASCDEEGGGIRFVGDGLGGTRAYVQVILEGTRSGQTIWVRANSGSEYIGVLESVGETPAGRPCFVLNNWTHFVDEVVAIVRLDAPASVTA